MSISLGNDCIMWFTACSLQCVLNLLCSCVQVRSITWKISSTRWSVTPHWCLSWCCFNAHLLLFAGYWEATQDDGTAWITDPGVYLFTGNLNECVFAVSVARNIFKSFFFLLQALEEQISQEESSSQALREEVLAKEQNMLELHTAMKEVSYINHHLQKSTNFLSFCLI